MHLNAFYDLTTHTYTDALLQPVHNKNEFGAFCDMVDRHEILEGSKNVYIGDRGYCSYNNMAHVIEQDQFFLFRTKDIHSKGLVGNFDFRKTNLLTLMSKLLWSEAIQEKSGSILTLTNASWIKRLLLITSLMGAMKPMSLRSVL